MSSNQKKQSVSTDKKKMSFFNFGRSRAPAPPENTAPAKKEPVVEAVEIADTEVNAAVLHSTGNPSDKPSTSARGQMRKFANFFKRSNAANSKKVVKQANVAAEDVPFPVESGQGQMEALQQKDDLSLKEDGAKVDASPAEVEKEVKEVKAATKIQALFRGHNERRKYLKKKQNVVKIEALARGFLARKHFDEMKGSSKLDNTKNEPSAEEISSKTLVTNP